MLGHFTEICGKRSGTRTGFSPNTVPADLHYTLLFVYFILLPEGRKGEACSEISIIQNSCFLLFTFSNELDYNLVLIVEK